MTFARGLARLTIPLGVKAAFWTGVYYIGPVAVISTVGLVPALVTAAVITLGGVDLVAYACI